jgi:hypothetical protein
MMRAAALLWLFAEVHANVHVIGRLDYLFAMLMTTN